MCGPISNCKLFVCVLLVYYLESLCIITLQWKQNEYICKNFPCTCILRPFPNSNGSHHPLLGFLFVVLSVGHKRVCESRVHKGAVAKGSVNIDVVRQDGSFPPVWKSRGVRSHLVNLLLQQTNKVEVCRLNRAEGGVPRCWVAGNKVTLKPFTWGWSYPEAISTPLWISSHVWMGSVWQEKCG